MKNLKFKIKKFKIVLDSGRLCLDTRGASIYVCVTGRNVKPLFLRAISSDIAYPSSS
jgi:hypothetical protein